MPCVAHILILASQSPTVKNRKVRTFSVALRRVLEMVRRQGSTIDLEKPAARSTHELSLLDPSSAPGSDSQMLHAREEYSPKNFYRCCSKPVLARHITQAAERRFSEAAARISSLFRACKQARKRRASTQHDHPVMQALLRSALHALTTRMHLIIILIQRHPVRPATFLHRIHFLETVVFCHRVRRRNCLWSPGRQDGLERLYLLRRHCSRKSVLPWRSVELLGEFDFELHV